MLRKNNVIVTMSALSLFTLSVGCGQDAEQNLSLTAEQESQDAIINGEFCAESVHPSAMAILTEADLSVFGMQAQIKQVTCTGTLIAPDVVMTAAHCLDASLLTGGFGEATNQRIFVSNLSDLTDIAQSQNFMGDLADYGFEAEAWVAHVGFNINELQGVSGPGEYDDIGLIFLKEPVDLPVSVVVSPEEGEQIKEGLTVDIAGWGQQVEDVGGPFSGALPPGTKHCVETFIGDLGPTEMQIGGDNTTGRKCHGDSGGPTYMDVDTGSAMEERVIGITSHAYDQTDCAKGGVDTRADAYYEWIDDQMTQACDEGIRSWCDIKGVIPPGSSGVTVQCIVEDFEPTDGFVVDSWDEDIDDSTDGMQVNIVLTSKESCADRTVTIRNDTSNVAFVGQADDNGGATLQVTLVEGDNAITADFGDDFSDDAVKFTVTFNGPEAVSENDVVTVDNPQPDCQRGCSSSSPLEMSLAGLFLLAFSRRRKLRTR